MSWRGRPNEGNGVNARNHQGNLRDIATFELLFSGGVHSKTGWRTTTNIDFADTQLSPLNNTTLNNVTLSVYLGDNDVITSNGTSIGSRESGNINIFHLTQRIPR